MAEEPDPATPDPSSDEAGDVGDAETEDRHADDGLDLARSISRATASAGGPLRKRRRSRRRIPGKVSGAHPDDRDPQLLDLTVGRLVSDHGWEVDLRVHGVIGRWPELVGDQVAEHCEPESFDEGRLVVRTDSTAWATQMKLLAPTVVRRLNEELGHGTVTVIEVLGPHLPTWKKGYYRTSGGRGPRDTYG